jgi:hypothetical protein
MSQLLPYFILLVGSLTAALFARRVSPSGKLAALCSLVPLVGYYLTREFC